jgi:cobalt-zinc-cadmium efflux system outer membrane protein
MNRRAVLPFVLMLLSVGCLPPAPTTEYTESLRRVRVPPGREETTRDIVESEATPPELAGAQPVEPFLSRALRENRSLQAKRYDLTAMRQRIPQARSLEEPRVEATAWPFPNYGPEYSLTGYMPLGVMLSQELPWLGTLNLRREQAEAEASAAEAELRAEELRVISDVKRAYYELYFNERAEELLAQSRGVASELLALAKDRYVSGGAGHGDFLRAEVAVSDVDRELESVREAVTAVRAVLAEAIHVDPGAELKTVPTLPPMNVAGDTARLVELARKKYFPDLQLGLTCDVMTTDHASSDMADDRDNLGFIIGFTLPIYRAKLDASLREAEAKAMADAKRYEAARDETGRLVAELLAKAKSRRDIVLLLRGTVVPRMHEAFQAARTDYASGTAQFSTVLTTWQDELRSKLELSRMEAELGGALADLDRVVGREEP